ncbi:MAG: hypothetical protein RMK30_04115 [Anaerolineae bacterium]|nr:hypothetical protein [Anaerolineae bacterium]
MDARTRLGEISPYVYGTNYGPWMVVPFELMDEAEEARITFLRFPGGNWGDQNDLMPYQIDQFIGLARRLGAEPSISVRLRGGSVKKAKELIYYTNVEKGYNVRFWSIGNEPSLYPDYNTERYNAEWRTYALALKEVDPNILLIGPDIHQYTGNPDTDPKDSAGKDWMEEFLRANGDLVDIVSIHRYPFPRDKISPPATVAELRENSREWDEIIPKLREKIRQITGRDLPVAVTEVNSHWSKAVGGEATPDSFYNAIWWADVLGRLIRQQVYIVAHFCLQTPSGSGGWGLLESREVRPTYYVYRMYRHFGEKLVLSSSDSPEVSVYASIRSDGSLALMLVNLGDNEVLKPLTLEGFRPSGLAEHWLFDSRYKAEKVGEIALKNGFELNLPARSVSLFLIPGRILHHTELGKLPDE